MKTLLTFLAGMIIGSAVMLLIIGLCIMAGDEDRKNEEMHTKEDGK